jgi:hypothetical protein
MYKISGNMKIVVNYILRSELGKVNDLINKTKAYQYFWSAMNFSYQEMQIKKVGPKNVSKMWKTR